MSKHSEKQMSKLSEKQIAKHFEEQMSKHSEKQMCKHSEDRLNYRSLLQNIVSFIGLFCKRDLLLFYSCWICNSQHSDQ